MNDITIHFIMKFITFVNENKNDERNQNKNNI